MTDKKPTDNEIAKTIPLESQIEYCNERIKEVFDSYYRRHTDGGEEPLNICVLRDCSKLIYALNDLINRQKADLKLAENINHLQMEELLNQKTEIKRLQKFKAYFDSLYGCNLEVLGWHENGDVVDFDEFYDSAMEDMENAYHHIEYTIKTAKAKAIKEFASKLIDKLCIIPQHHFTFLEVAYDIDNLVKETVGEQNG